MTIFSKAPLGAGGWVTGNAISPDGLTRLARTDTLGAYYWDSVLDKWRESVTVTSMPASYNATDTGVGVQALAAANTVAYMAYSGAIFKSVDRGRSWALSASGPATAPNTGNQRWYGNRMAIDPNDSTHVIYGTVADGLYFTVNGGTTWTQVSSGLVPVGTSGWGIPSVAIDPSGNWYAAPHASGLYRSTDRGSSWTKISSDSDFIVVRFLRAAANGDLMMTTHTDSAQTSQAQIFRLRSGTFTNVKPSVNQKWHDIAYDPTVTGRVFALAEGGYQALSTDGGTSWTQPLKTMDSDADIPWLANANGFGNLLTFITAGEINFDPVVSGRLWFSQGIGVWYADLTATPSDPIAWHAQSRGIEQLVVNDVICPPGGPTLCVSWDRSVFIIGETSAAPQVSIATPPSTPIHTAAPLAATLVAGYPLTITYTWTVVSAPGGSTALPAAPSSLSTSFTPDVVGSYTLRLTGTNSAGSGHADVTVTAIAAITGLSLPGTTGNFGQTPADSSLDLTGSFTLQAKLALASWTPAKTAIVGKYGSTSKSYALNVDSTGLLAQIASASDGSAGSFNVSSGVLGFPDGSTQWVQLVYDATAKTVTFSKSTDGSSWTAIKTVSTSGGMGANPIATSTAPLTIGFTGNLSTYATGTIYQAKVLNASGTTVAAFNAEAVTRTGTRLPATYTDSTSKVWTPQGSAWDWVS